MGTIFDKVNGWFDSTSVSKAASYRTTSIPLNPQEDRIGVFKADYSPISEEDMAFEDPECVDLFKNSDPASR